MVVRSRRPEDIARCLAVLRDVHDFDGYPANWPRQPPRWLVADEAVDAWVAEEDGTLLGHLSLHSVDQSAAWPAWSEALGVPAERLRVVSRFFVSPHSRGRGAGAALMQRAEHCAAAQGTHLVLDVADHNHDAISFYEHRGWLQVGTAALPPGDQGLALRVLLFVAPELAADGAP